jgi:hypothetical protein
MKLSTPVAAEYIPAFKRALFWQALCFGLSALMLDFFYHNHLVVVAVISHWIAIVIILVRRPDAPTSVDLFYCRAFPLMLAITIVLAPIVMGGYMGGPPDYRTLLHRWFGFDLLHDFEFAGTLMLFPAVIWLVAYPFLGNAKVSPDSAIQDGPIGK